MKIRFKRISIIVLLVLAFLVIFFFAYKTFFASKPKYNLILISVDTLRPDHMGIYGYPKNTTPNIDKWATNAFVFTNVYTVTPVTYPSFIALMTGLSPLKTLVTGNRLYGSITQNGKVLSPYVETLPKILKKNGFTNAAFLSNPNASITSKVDSQEYLTYFKEGFDKYKLQYEGSNESFIDTSLKWLKSNKDKRIFFWIHLLDPHAPYIPPKDLSCKFNPKYCDIISSEGLKKLDEERNKAKECLQKGLPKERIELYETLYDGEIGFSDRLIGKIFNAMRDLGLDKNSIVVFYGDHGEGFDHNYFFAHGQVLYNSSIKIPFIIKMPQQKNGKENPTFINNTDILPALLSLLEIKHPLEIDGKNFLSGEKRDRSYFQTYDLKKFAIIDGKYKFIYSLPDSCLKNGQTEELYDIKIDPQENSDLKNKQNNIAKNLREQLNHYINQFNMHRSSNIKVEKNDESNEIIQKLKSIGY